MSHFIVMSDHLPPARSQSTLLVWPEVGGLAEGVVPRSAGPDGVEPVEGPAAGVPAESLPVAPGAPTPVPPDPPLPLVDGLPGAVPDDGPLIPGVPPVPDGPLPGVPLPAGSPPGEPLPAPGALEPPAAPLPPAPAPPPAWAAATAGASPMTTTKPTRINFLFIPDLL
jgi:hypothetical protein